MNDPDWSSIEHLIEEIIEMQTKRVLHCGESMVPNLTQEDLLQPNDYRVLENSPLFRYEEGVLIGMKTMQAALRAHRREREHH